MIVYEGVVERGEEKARRFGFPTMNIVAPGLSLFGTYAGMVTVDGTKYPAAMYADPGRGLLEAHLLGVSGDFYEKAVVLELEEKIADAQHFGTEEEAQRYIAECVEKVRDYFKE